jgi:streptogramin lyase
VGAGSIWSTTYVSSTDEVTTERVLRVDPVTMQVVDEIPVPLASAVAFADGVVWVMTSPPSTSRTLFIPTRKHPGTVLRIDPATDQFAGNALPVPGLQPISIVAEGTSAWIADYTDQTLTRIDVVASASPSG